MSDIIIEVFRRFTASYGNRWTQSRDLDLWPLTVEQWERKLSKFSVNLVLECASEASRFYPDWPPTDQQFYEICKIEEANRERDSRSYCLKIEEQKASEEVARFYQNQINEILEKKKKDHNETQML